MRVSKRRMIITATLTLIVGILMGWLLFGNSSSSGEVSHSHETENTGQIWTCSMHPQIRKIEAGNCPICGMDLIPLASVEDSEANPNAIKMSPTAMQLANVQTAIVQLGSATKELNLTGKISADERNVYTQTAHIAGRVERLDVNFEGEKVQRGQVIGSLYSPELVTAQEELFIAVQNQESQPQLLAAAKNKLKNWKLTDEQIEQLILSGKTTDEFSVLADYSGVVLDLNVEKGDYLKEGQAFYEVADLSKLWVLLDVHESDLAWVKKGDQVEFKVKAFPSESFTGTINFIDPIIDSKTRVAQARIEINNSKQKFKPEMLVTAAIESDLQANENSIVVPKSAVMWTGDRSVVYVKSSAANGLHFTMREVELGASLGDSYIIQSGLSEGEEIAVNGTFSIDAAAQLAGKPSMMNPEGGQMNMGHNHGGNKKMDATPKETSMQMNKEKIKIDEKAKKILTSLFENYFELKDALTEDDLTTAKSKVNSLQKSFEQVNMALFTGDAHLVWMDYSKKLDKNLEKANKAEDIDQIRESFIPISIAVIGLNEKFEPIGYKVYVQHCPMANNNKGADWLSKEEEIKNPYFGSSMLDCGELKSTMK